MDTIEEKIFDFAYGEALNDATRRVYSGKDKVAEIKDARKIVKDYIDAILNLDIKNSNVEKTDFYLTAFKVERAINNNENIKLEEYFNFGKTQKLINMTAKHFYMLCYQNDDFREKFKYCHCPMDRIIRDKAALILKMANKMSEKPKGTWDKEYAELKETAWSKLAREEEIDLDTKELEKDSIPEVYKLFQATIKAFCDVRGMYPIEFDYYYWQESNEALSKALEEIMKDEKKKDELIERLKNELPKE